MPRLIRHMLNRRSQDCTCVPGKNAHYSTLHCKIARVCYLSPTKRNEYPSSISLACHERENLRENKEAGFHAQMHSLRVNKYVNGIRLVNTKCFFENIWKSCTTILSRCEQTRSSGIKKKTQRTKHLWERRKLFTFCTPRICQRCGCRRFATVAKYSTFMDR